MKLFVAVVLVAGCATGGVTRNRDTHLAYGVESIVVGGNPRAGQLSASRLWERGAPSHAIAAADDAELRDAFARDLDRVLPLDDTAPVRIRATLTLQDIGYFEGLAAEATDVTLAAKLVDVHGNVLRTITLRESASAPLQRSASRKARLESAFDRLAHRLAAQL
jgi:hypothetical protein